MLFVRALLEATVEFLDEHDVETSELAWRSVARPSVNSGTWSPAGRCRRKRRCR